MVFDCWVPFLKLETSKVPDSSGVYLVVAESGRDCRFAQRSVGGWFKGKDPTVSIAELQDNWVEGAEVLCIGKADRLRQRLMQLGKFGEGVAIGHWGVD